MLALDLALELDLHFDAFERRGDEWREAAARAWAIRRGMHVELKELPGFPTAPTEIWECIRIRRTESGPVIATVFRVEREVAP